MASLPPGYKFLPTDQELIELFLATKQNGFSLSEDYRIPEKNLYEAVPWDVIKDDDPWEEPEEDSKKKIIYVFCKLSYTGQSKNRVARTAGSGTWEGKAVSVNIKNLKGMVIGKRRQFAFKMNKGFEKEMKGKGHWIMTKYSFLDYGNYNNGYVICKITKDFSKETKKRVQDYVPAAANTNTVVVDRSNGKRKFSGTSVDDNGIHKRKEIITNESGSFSLNQQQFLPMEHGGFTQCSSPKGPPSQQGENWSFNQYPRSQAQMFGFQNQMQHSENKVVIQDSSTSQPLSGFEYHVLNNPASNYLSLLQNDDGQGNLNTREEQLCRERLAYNSSMQQFLPPLVEECEEDDQREVSQCDAAGVQGISGPLDVSDSNEWFSEVMKMFDFSLINPISL